MLTTLVAMQTGNAAPSTQVFCYLQQPHAWISHVAITAVAHFYLYPIPNISALKNTPALQLHITKLALHNVVVKPGAASKNCDS